MATFEDFLNKARDLAEAAGKKTTEMVDKTKVKMEISTLQKQLAATFEGLGRLVYDAEAAGEDIADMKQTAFETVKELQEQIDALQGKLYDYEGAVRCKECGAVNDGDAVFCKNCGKSV
ncbi:MAG: hypothetical protein IJC52_03760 [Clostridia bacterium]|nr:hypothetical protein [Clostridia bacterium]